MSILINKETVLLIQGICGREGMRAARAARDYNTRVDAGVDPGKGGMTVDDTPVYDTIHEALTVHPRINATAIYVPPRFVKSAVLEAIKENIPFINIMTEGVPVQDTAYFLAAARESGCVILGPSSIGIISAEEARIGLAGGDKPEEIYIRGSIGVISRSGGMMNELSWQLRKRTIGISTAVHIGGDALVGMDYANVLRHFQNDKETQGVVIFGELGGRYEFAIVECIKRGLYTKPLAMYVGGKFGNVFPEGMAIGHAGSIIERGLGSVQSKEEALKSVGVFIAEKFEDLPLLIKPFCK